MISELFFALIWTFMKFEKLGQSGRARRGRLTLAHVFETPYSCLSVLTVQLQGSQ